MNNWVNALNSLNAVTVNTIISLQIDEPVAALGSQQENDLFMLPKATANEQRENNMYLKIVYLSLYGIRPTTGLNRVRCEKLVGDRERWKDITAASMAGRAFRMTT